MAIVTGLLPTGTVTVDTVGVAVAGPSMMLKSFEPRFTT